MHVKLNVKFKVSLSTYLTLKGLTHTQINRDPTGIPGFKVRDSAKRLGIPPKFNGNDAVDTFILTAKLYCKT